MVMAAGGNGFGGGGFGGSKQKQLNLNSPFSNLSQDPAIQQGLLGNWAFSLANQGKNGGRSYFEGFQNMPKNPQTGRDGFMQLFGKQMLSAYDSHVESPNLEADILFQDTFMGGNGNKKQNLWTGLLGGAT
jgi:hypothetical protein